MGVRHALRIGAIAATSAIAAAVAFPTFLAIRAGDDKVIVAEPMDSLLLVLAVALIAVGVQVAMSTSRPYVAFLAAIGSAALLFGILGIFGVGIAFVPLAVVALVLLYRALRRRPSRLGRSAAIGGSLIGYGVILAYIAMIVPAVVECHPNGAGTSSGRWGPRTQQVVGGLSVSPGGGATGHIESSTYRATFRCEGGRVVEFNREAP